MILKMTDSKQHSKQLLQIYFEKYCSGKKMQEQSSIEMTASILNSIVGFNRFHNSVEKYCIYENDTIVFSNINFIETRRKNTTL